MLREVRGSQRSGLSEERIRPALNPARGKYKLPIVNSLVTKCDAKNINNRAMWCGGDAFAPCEARRPTEKQAQPGDGSSSRAYPSHQVFDLTEPQRKVGDMRIGFHLVAALLLGSIFAGRTAWADENDCLYSDAHFHIQDFKADGPR